jgi:Tol biopolymer transport system component
VDEFGSEPVSAPLPSHAQQESISLVQEVGKMFSRSIQLDRASWRPALVRRRLRFALAAAVVAAAAACSAAWSSSSGAAVAAFPGSNGKIAFMSNRSGNFDIYTMRGTNVVQLTTDPADDARPSWSADGRRIVFVRAGSGFTEIWRMRADGGGQRRLTRSGSHNDAPVFSPDGTKISWEQDGDIWTMNADGSGQVDITNDPALDTNPSWAPDGARIVFDSDRSGTREIYSMLPDGSDVTQLTTDSVNTDPDWSPDGQRIVFVSFRTGNAEIFAMDADGSNQIDLTNNQHYDADPAWAPDGTRIAFTSLRHGNFEVYTMLADGSMQSDRTDNPASDNFPSWQPRP